MVQAVKDSFLDLERHRQMLEENIEKLQKSLQHWQTWEAEYEGLKEAILAVQPPPDRKQLLAIGRAYEGQQVTKKEVEEILGIKTSRSAAQVINVVDRRMDYVEQNIRTIQKQMESAEERLAAATVISTPDVRNEEGLPMTEIIEELDDEGNVIASRISTPGSAKPQLLELLEKAGVKDLPHGETSASQVVSPLENNRTGKPVLDDTEHDISEKHESEEPVPQEAGKPMKKGVKFTEGTKSGPEPEKSQTAKRLEEIMTLAKQQAIPPTEPPVIPTDESPEDAALRKDMLQYGLSEVGSVVAELNLEDGSDWTEDEYDDDEASSMDGEDEFGRSTGQAVDEELRREMIALEQKLGVRMMENIGNKASDYDIVQEGIGRVTINGQEAAPKGILSAAKTDKGRLENGGVTNQTTTKSVKFSESLDISPAPQLAPVPTSKSRKRAPVSDIIERSAQAETAVSTSSRKTSRFKAARATNSSSTTRLPPSASNIQFASTSDLTRTVPTGPADQILASNIIEHPTPLSMLAVEPDELDPNLLQQEVATEYHKMRNRMIQRQGGFLKEDESEIVPFTEEEGGPKRMSRFKAARLARS